MPGSLLGYRVFRLRRLIVVCLGLVAAGIGLGIWLIPEPATALQVALGVGLFSILAVAHLAMILIWPADQGGPLTYATGTLILSVLALPAGAHVLANGTDAAPVVVFGVMLGPLVWLVAAPWPGGWILWLVNKALPQNQRRVRVFDLPLDLDRAITLFALDPDKRRLLSVLGPVGWDGCFEETATRMVADLQTGVLSEHRTISRLRTLEKDATTRSVLITTSHGGDLTISMVVHQRFEATPTGTRLTERLDIAGVPGLALWMGWLWDGEADHVTAELDADAGRPARAICHLPLDSMGLAVTRFFKWGDPTPG